MLSIKVDGMSAVVKKIADISNLDDLGLVQVAEMARRDVLDHFASEQGPKGGWKATKRPNKILQDTGRLRNSIRARAVGRTAMVTAGTKYAATHNFGDPSRNIEQRQFMYLSKKATKEITSFVAKKAIRKKGAKP